MSPLTLDRLIPDRRSIRALLGRHGNLFRHLKPITLGIVGCPLSGNRPTLPLVLCPCLVRLVESSGTPVSVKQVDPRAVHREFTGNVLSTGAPSRFTQTVLNQADLFERFKETPEKALATHRQGPAGISLCSPSVEEYRAKVL